MKALADTIRLSATDLSNHLACPHVTTLDLSVLRGVRAAPEWRAPDLAVIQELGARHEAAYLDQLRGDFPSMEDLREMRNDQAAVDATLACMQRGVEVIAQGALSSGRWFGRPDVLRKVARESRFGDWSYEVYDCKLTRETKATTILQLALYTALLAAAQNTFPEFMHVVTRGTAFAPESYRYAEYAAYYRYVHARLEAVCSSGAAENTYPEPCVHCDICRWFAVCDARRRADDHLSLVAGIRRQQRIQLEEWKTPTLAKLAVMPIPLQEKPRSGSREGMERTREQARVQFEGRKEHRLILETLLPVTQGMGFCRLPEPCADDVFVDLEGDPFAGDNGFQYLYGLAFKDANGALRYEKRWALTREEEKQGFEWLVDEIMRRRSTNPKMHAYHFGAYEPGALKRLMGMYATREEEIDRMLRAGVLVDLHQAFKQSLRASVEEYSLKKLEAFYGFVRKTPLDQSRAAMRYIEHRLELGWKDELLAESVREAMEGYNAEDCYSTLALRDFLEAGRRKLVDQGVEVTRFTDRPERAPEKLDERQRRVAALVQKLVAGVPADTEQRNAEEQGRWLIAQLLDWHRREDKAGYWEGYRLADLDDQDLLDERAGLAGLAFIKRLPVDGKVLVDRYSFEKQETEVRAGKDVYYKGEKFGCAESVNLATRIIDIKKTRKTSEVHPAAIYAWDRPYDVKDQAEALYRMGAWIAENGVNAQGTLRAGRDLLLRRPPRLLEPETLRARASETPDNTASRVAASLDHSAFAIQGPPGSGKTYTGARMICELVKQGKKIGVAALSHKVIRKLLDDVVEAANNADLRAVRCLHRDNNGAESDGVAVAKENNAEALQALRSGKANVVGGVSWLWAAEDSFEAVDVLFIDEAGQMGLADVLAISQAGKNLALLGDPQQLERPLKGSHPEGAEKSALEHLLGGHKTISEDMGFLLPQSWRLHPKICEFTSSVFYEGKLSSNPITRNRVLAGHPWLHGAGLWFVPVEHEGNRNSSAEEVEAVARIVEGLLRPEVRWFYSTGNSRGLREEDILLVAPYNAQVADLCARLPKMRVGTVDKFQGQEAAVLIYSLTTSSPEDAPRGMEFLYSLNRLNVATSRAMSNVIVVGSPRLLEPECRSPRQMQLANALCRYRELATEVNA